MTIRYSPLPISEYGELLKLRSVGRKNNVMEVGPGASAFLANDPEAWNLAFLSHPYEGRNYHKDPLFSVHVRRTLQIRLDTGELDIVGQEPELRVRALFRLPPLRAVLRLLSLPPSVVRSLPLYIAYGEAWEKQIRRRASFLTSAQDPEEDVTDVSEAVGYLRRFGRDIS